MRRPIHGIIAIFLWFFGIGPVVNAAEPTPFLQVETGMHQATINRLVTIRDGSAVATVSDDKSARIWSADTLEPLGVIRPPIGPGDDGALDAVAASGDRLAVAGRIRYGDMFGVQFYRTSDLRLIGHRSELPAPISALSFSRSGETLAVGMAANRGLAFLDMRNGAQIAADSAYTGQVQWIDTAADGRTVTSGEDGRVRLYGPSHTKIADVALPRGAHPYAVTFSPDGQSIAVGVQNNATIWLLHAMTLRPLTSLTGAAGRTGGFAVVVFSRDGRELIAAGTYKAALNAPRLLRRWTLGTGRAVEFEAGGDTITDVLPVSDGILLSDAEPVLTRLDGGGHQIALRTANHIDFRDAGISGFAISSDGGRIELPLGRAAAETVFDVRMRTLSQGRPTESLQRPRDAADGMMATQWRNTTTPRLNGRPVPLEPGEQSLSVAVASDGSAAVLGTSFYIRYVRKDGTAWQVLAPSPAWAVNVSDNGTRVVAGLSDGTVRWFDAENGNALLTLFLDPLQLHWVLSTPEGFFDHDNAPRGQSDGRNLIGYRFNDPSAQVSRFVDTGQLYPIYYRPDLVGMALSRGRAATTAIRLAYERKGNIQTVLARGLPAFLEVQEICGVAAIPSDGRCPTGQGSAPIHHGRHAAQFFTSEASVLVRYRLSSPSGSPGSVSFSRDGAGIEPAIQPVSEDTHSRIQAALIPLGDGVNNIRLLPVSANKEIEGNDSTAISFEVVRSMYGAVDRRKLFVLSVGINRYRRPLYNLTNSANDAIAVAEIMRKPDAPIYYDTVVTSLYDDQATLSGISLAIQLIAQRATPDDIVLIFFAGHGDEVDGRFYFAPADFGTRYPDLVRIAQTSGSTADLAFDQLFIKEGFGHDQMVSLLKQVKASRVAIILDTCYSGAIASQDAVSQRDVNKTMARTLGHGAGRIVLSSATDEAQDDAPDLTVSAHNHKGHGMFTGYLLDALEGEAADPDEDKIDVAGLAKFTIRMVKKATLERGQLQEPTFYFEGNDFFALRSARNAHP
jgi:WD40 repeat protein